MGQIAVALAAIALAVFFQVEADRYSATAARMPILLSWVLITLSLAMLADGLLRLWRGRATAGRPLAVSSGGPGETASAEGEDASLAAREPLSRLVARVAYFIALVLGYAIALEPLGYFIATPLFLAGVLLGLRALKPLSALALTLGAVVVIYGVFVYLLRLPIPLTFFS